MSETWHRVLEEVRPVAACFRDAGFEVYLVGGIVRDLELGAGIDDLDFDLTTPARPDQIRQVVAPIAEAVWNQGERFGTIGCQIDGREYEITTHRAEWYSSASRKPEVAFGDRIDADLARRDFTVNAMAIRLPEGELIDPHGGSEHLLRGLLVTPMAPEESFSDDPLRILRAARFVARYGLTPTPELRDAAHRLVERMAIVSIERVRDELDKVLDAERPSAGLRFLDDVGALEFVLEYADPGRHDLTGEQLDRTTRDLELRRLVLMGAVEPQHRRDQLRALRYPNAEIRAMSRILDGLDRIESSTEWSDEGLRRLVDDVGFEHMDQLLRLAEVRGTAEAITGPFRDLAARESLESLAPELSGAEIMEELGLPEGREIGAVLERLRERRLREGPLSKEGELDFLREA